MLIDAFTAQALATVEDVALRDYLAEQVQHWLIRGEAKSEAVS
jgi:hypothetical protein